MVMVWKSAGMVSVFSILRAELSNTAGFPAAN